MDGRLGRKKAGASEELTESQREMAKVLVRPYVRDLLNLAEIYGLTFQIRIRKTPGGVLKVNVGMED